MIAGGGPGGLAAAEAAARGGAAVLVVEQNKEIGSPIRTSGGSFLEDLKQLGIPEHLYHPIRRGRFLSPNNSAAFAWDQPVLCVMDVRGVYQHLAMRAVAAGARIAVNTAAVSPLMEGERVAGVRLKSGEIRAKILVDATGHRAVMLEQAGVHPGWKRFGVGSEYDLYAPHCDQDEAVLLVGGQVAPAGYAWFFPWGNGRVRAGVGILHGDSAAHPDAYLGRLIERASDFGVDLRGAQPLEYHFGLIPSEGLAGAFTADGLMGVGDSAGQPSALLGEGIRWAILAGRMAGGVAAEAIRQGDCSRGFLSRYEKQWNAEHGTNLRIAYEINRRISQWDDGAWDRKTELLKLLTPAQFAEALRSNFVARWPLEVVRAHPGLMKEGLRVIVRHLGLAG